MGENSPHLVTLIRMPNLITAKTRAKREKVNAEDTSTEDRAEKLARYCFFSLRKFGEQAGTDVMILKIFSPKNLSKNWRFLLKTKLIMQTFDLNIGFFKKSAIFSPKMVKNRRKL
jgi:hypothetical protein